LVKFTPGMSRESSVPPLRIAALMARESRPCVQTMYLLRFFVGVWLADAGGFLGWQVAAGAVSWLCVCVAIYAVNGVADVQGDRHNRSSRPIASGELDAQTATQAILWLALAGLVMAALVSAQLVVVFVLMFGIGWLYSCGPRPFKNSLAGLVFSGTALGLLSVLAGWLASGGGPLGVDVVVLGAGLALWMGLVGTATKDLKDVPGDRLAGRRTLPVLLGIDRAKAVAGVVALAHGCVFVLAARSLAPGMVPAAGCALLGAVGVAAVVVCSAGPRSGRRAYGAYMITQYVAALSALAQ
jgi:4-hydroxybenzoate polyprenyltransferase